MAKFDLIFFDSGGTLYQGGQKGENSPSHFFKNRTDRLFPLFQQYGFQGTIQDLMEAIECAEFTCSQNFENYLYNYSEVILELKKNILPLLSNEECFMLTDVYAGPRLKAWLFPDTLNGIKQLNKMGILQGIIANTVWPGFCMDRAFAAIGLLPFFQYRVYSGDVQLKKPDLQIFKYAEKLASANGKRILYVGNDIEKDIIPPKEIGWSTALREPNPESKTNSPADFQFYEIMDLVKYCQD